MWWWFALPHTDNAVPRGLFRESIRLKSSDRESDYLLCIQYFEHYFPFVARPVGSCIV